MSEEKDVQLLGGDEAADTVETVDIAAEADDESVIDELGEIYDEEVEASDVSSEPAESAITEESFEHIDVTAEEDIEAVPEQTTEAAVEPVEEAPKPVEAPRKAVPSPTAAPVPEKRPTPPPRPAPPKPPEVQPAPAVMPTVPEKRRTSPVGVISLILSALTLCAIGAGAYFGLGALRRVGDELEQNRQRIAELEAAREADYAEVMNVIESEKEEPPKDEDIELGKGKILLYDSTVGYTWAPIIEGVPLNDYDPNSFTLSDDNRMTYYEDGEISSYFGIDVSSYQGEIDWNAVRADGIEFAILRIGLRGYGEEGNIKPDAYFEDNYKAAHAAGVDLGVYFFSQAITVDEAIEEAKCVLEWLDGRKLEYPVVFDWEPAVTLEDDVSRTEDLMPQTLTLSAIAFCETVQEAGYDAMIYTNKKLAVLKYDMRQLSCYPVWLASYRPELTYPYDFDIWQYGLGYVDGIEGEVDFDIAIIK